MAGIHKIFPSWLTFIKKQVLLGLWITNPLVSPSIMQSPVPIFVYSPGKVPRAVVVRMPAFVMPTFQKVPLADRRIKPAVLLLRCRLPSLTFVLPAAATAPVLMVSTPASVTWILYDTPAGFLMISPLPAFSITRDVDCLTNALESEPVSSGLNLDWICEKLDYSKEISKIISELS